jgi:hypothetical protein
MKRLNEPVRGNLFTRLGRRETDAVRRWFRPSCGALAQIGRENDRDEINHAQCWRGDNE